MRAIGCRRDIAAWVRALKAYAPLARHEGLQFMGGTPDEIPERYQRVRVLSLANQINQPVLLIRGTADMRIPPHHSVWMEHALRAAGNNRVRLEQIPGMGHFLELSTLGYQFDMVIRLVTEWLAELG